MRGIGQSPRRKKGLAIRLGGAGSRWLPVRSRREALRTWTRLTAVGRFAEVTNVGGDRMKSTDSVPRFIEPRDDQDEGSGTAVLRQPPGG